jgi:DNA-binding NarL/FixJ family response regulator
VACLIYASAQCPSVSRNEIVGFAFVGGTPVEGRSVEDSSVDSSRACSSLGVPLSPKAVKLSKQQKHILNLLAKGYKYKEIMDLTGLTIHTVKSHATAAYGKLDVNNSMDAVLKARELGLIE